MSVLKGEGKVPILFGSQSFSAGSVIHGGYLARPDLTGEWPTVLVMSPAWGVTSSIKDICRRLARHGFAAVAPDVHAGLGARRDTTRLHAELLAATLSPRRIAGIVDDFVEFIQNPAGYWSNAERGYGVLGVGSGARLAAASAAMPDVLGLGLLAPTFLEPHLDEEGEMYTEDTTAVLGGVTAPILALTGSQDPAMDGGGLERARSAAPHAGWIVYDGLDGDFADDYAEGFDQPAFADAMDRLIEFYEKVLPQG